MNAAHAAKTESGAMRNGAEFHFGAHSNHSILRKNKSNALFGERPNSRRRSGDCISLIKKKRCGVSRTAAAFSYWEAYIHCYDIQFDSPGSSSQISHPKTFGAKVSKPVPKPQPPLNTHVNRMVAVRSAEHTTPNSMIGCISSKYRSAAYAYLRTPKEPSWTLK